MLGEEQPHEGRQSKEINPRCIVAVIGGVHLIVLRQQHQHAAGGGGGRGRCGRCTISSRRAEEAKAVIDAEENVIILDVREQYEYDEGHIPGAVLLPSGSVKAKASEVLPDKNQKILVYCRSGNRSGTAARALVALGYTQIYDFGGIINWPYDVVKD